MSKAERIILGALGGLSAVLVKFLGQDYTNLVAHAANLTADQLLAYKLGYGLLTPILMFLGAFAAWVSDEQKRVKIVALAVAAPAMITTWSGGHKDSADVAFNFVPTAYAQPFETPSFELVKEKFQAINPDVLTEKDTWQHIESAILTFFGYNKDPQKYLVIVGSFKEKEAAQQFADSINTENKTLNAWVGHKIDGNAYYPVVVGDYAYLSDARKLKQKAMDSKLIKDAYFVAGGS